MIHDGVPDEQEIIAAWICVASGFPCLGASLHTIFINGNYSSETSERILISLASVLPALSKLRCLRFIYFTVTNRGMAYLTAVFPLLSSLDSLSFDEIMFDDNFAVSTLSLALPQLPVLRSLSFVYTDFSLERMTSLAASFPHLPHLTELSLQTAEIVGHGAIIIFFRGLSHLHELSTLNLSRTLTSGETALFSQRVSHSSLLFLLSLLRDSWMGDDAGCIALCGALPSIASSLTQLDLSCNEIGDAGCLALCRVLLVSLPSQSST